MTEATLTLAAMEACRNEALLRLTVLDAQRPKVAYAIVAENSVTAKQRWRAIDDEADRLLERLRLFDAAVYEARERAMHSDWRQQFAEICGVKL